MKAEELMIGDWVKCKDPRCEGHQVDFIDLGNEEFGLDGEIYDFDNFEPIPLTPEILEKNGFEKSVIQTVLMKEQQIPPTIRYGIQLGEYSGIYISFGLQDCPLYDIRSHYRLFQGACNYVHELQHALKLCEIEKEIIL